MHRCQTNDGRRGRQTWCRNRSPADRRAPDGWPAPRTPSDPEWRCRPWPPTDTGAQTSPATDAGPGDPPPRRGPPPPPPRPPPPAQPTPRAGPDEQQPNKEITTHITRAPDDKQ